MYKVLIPFYKVPNCVSVHGYGFYEIIDCRIGVGLCKNLIAVGHNLNTQEKSVPCSPY